MPAELRVCGARQESMYETWCTQATVQRGAQALLGEELAADVGYRIFGQRPGRISTLLGTVVHQPVFANIEITRAGPAAPLVLFAVRDVVLEIVELRVTAFLHAAHGRIDFAFLVGQRLQLAGTVVDDAHRGREPQIHGAVADCQGVLGIPDATSHHGIDIHVKIGVLGQKLELSVQHLQALFRNLVGRDIVDADLQVVQPRAVQAFDALGGEQVAVGDHARDHALAADVRDDQIQIRMQ